MTVTPPPPGDSDGVPDGDIDAEFARLMAGIDLTTPDDAEKGELTVEDVLSAPRLDPSADPAAAQAAGDSPPVALIATSVASAKALAGALRLGGVGGESNDAPSSGPGGSTEARQEPTSSELRVHDTEAGAIIVAELDETSAHAAAASVSAALAKLGIVLFWRRGDRMTATRYRAGKRGDDVSPALLLGGVDAMVEQVLLGAAAPDELGEGIDPSTVSRMQALRWIALGRGRA